MPRYIAKSSPERDKNLLLSQSQQDATIVMANLELSVVNFCTFLEGNGATVEKAEIKLRKIPGTIGDNGEPYLVRDLSGRFLIECTEEQAAKIRERGFADLVDAVSESETDCWVDWNGPNSMLDPMYVRSERKSNAS